VDFGHETTNGGDAVEEFVVSQESLDAYRNFA
jgi:hypothetical protein